MRTEIIQEFLVFAKHLSFSRAAKELHITQPNLSKHMMELEREVGVELIDRKTFGKNRPVLSEAGKYFFEEMSYVNSSIQSTLKRCRAIGRSSTRDIRILELWQNKAMNKLYSIAGAYQSEFPESSVRYVRLSGKQPIDALIDNEFDLVFDVWCGPYEERCAELTEQGMRVIHFLTDQICIWYQEDNPHVAGKNSLRLEDLLDIPVIMTRGGTWDYMVLSYANYCTRKGLDARLRHLQPYDNTPTGMFMSDFRDGVLMTTPAMMNDPRLASRSDLRYLVADDDRIAVSFLLVARGNDKGSCEFLDYAARRKKA